MREELPRTSSSSPQLRKDCFSISSSSVEKLTAQSELPFSFSCQILFQKKNLKSILCRKTNAFLFERNGNLEGLGRIRLDEMNAVPVRRTVRCAHPRLDAIKRRGFAF